MKPEEKIVFEYLKKKFPGEKIVYESDGGIPPDFAINSSIGVEVRRLNQNFIRSGESEGLEDLSFDLYAAFKDVLKSLSSLRTSKKSYYVYLQYKRPLSHKLNMRQAKKDMERALSNVIELDITTLPYDIPVNLEITLTLYKRQSNDGKLFSPSGSYDDDMGGEHISVYAQNINYCIAKKSSLVSIHLHKYNEWWLYLVDRIGFPLDTSEISEITSLIGNTGNFDGVFLLSADGQNIIVAISR